MNRSYAHGTSSTPLVGATVGDSLAATVADHPDALALVSRHQGVRLTYAELAERVERVALALLAFDVQAGERVGIWAPTRVEWTELQYATARVGAILVNINPAYRRHELRHALGLAGVSTLVCAPGFRGVDYLDMVASVRDELPQLRRVISFDGVAGGGSGDLAWDQFLGERADAAALAEREGQLDPSDPINIQFTSGTTGSPKGATLTHHNIVNNARIMADTLAYGPDDAVCIPVPLYHCFGMVGGNLACTTSGATIVYPAEAFEPLATLEAAAEERCTSIYGVPTMFIAQLGHPRFADFDLTSLRTGIMGGSPCPVEVMKQVISDMHVSEISIAYGMTETSPASTFTRRDDSLDRQVSTVGTVLPHTEMKVVDPVTGRIVPRGATGEVCTRGYLVMRGYWDDPEATAEAVDADRWMHTGDLGVMDDQGYLNIVGRIKDMVIRGGENVYPREIEEVLYQHPAVSDAQVVGVPDARMGEELMAWVQLRDGAAAEEDDIRDFCRERLARFKVPRYVRFVDVFPMTVTGKIQKFRLRELGAEELRHASPA